MGDWPRVSVVVPTRNRLCFLKEAVQSVFAQTLDGYELIVVDDASEDGTWDWLRSLSHSRIRLFRQAENRERSAARNAGLREARGEMILFLDDDDLLLPGALGWLSAALDAHPEAVAAVGAREHREQGQAKKRCSHPSRAVVRRVWAEAFFAVHPSPSQTLFRAEMLRSCGGWNESISLAEDHELWLRVTRRGPVLFSPRVVAVSRKHPGQTPRGGVLEAHQKSIDEFTEGLRGEERELAERMRRASRELHAAAALSQEGRGWAGLRCMLRGLSRAPGLLLSPVAQAELALHIRGSVVDAIAPRGSRRRDALRRAKSALRRPHPRCGDSMSCTCPVEWAALLGRRDEPTDGVRDYCRWLGRALEPRGIKLIEAEVAWAEEGWGRALLAMWNQSGAWRGRWVLVQYTALAWSRRGFPAGMLAALWLLRLRGARTAVVFHSTEPQPGRRPLGRLRAACQRWVMQRASRHASRTILPVPLERAAWLGESRGMAAFIPVGPNIPANARGEHAGEPTKGDSAAQRTATAVVFGVTGAPSMEREVADICYAARSANQRLPAVAGLPGLRLLVLGRGSTEAEPLLEGALAGSGIKLEVLGILPAEDVARALAGADALLFVRGEVAANRGSAIAGLSCGLPIVGYGAPETSFPVSQAGARLVPCGDRAALAEALAEVLSDGNLQRELRERSRQALRDHFCWERIAERYIEVLDRG